MLDAARALTSTSIERRPRARRCSGCWRYRACALARLSRLERDDVDPAAGRDHNPRTDRQPHRSAPGLIQYTTRRSPALRAIPTKRGDKLCPRTALGALLLVPRAVMRGTATRSPERRSKARRSATTLGLRTQTTSPAHARSAPQLCLCVTLTLRSRAAAATHRRTDRAAVDLPRARRPGRHLLVSVRRPRAARRSPPSGSTRTSEGRHDRARPHAAGVLHRTADRVSARPARTRSPPTATPSGCCSPSAEQTGTATIAAGHRRPRRAADRRVPRPPRDTTAATAPRTRNPRLAAIHSLFGYAALRHPEHAAVIQRVLAIPPKRTDRTLITYLTEPEIDALLAAPDRTTWTGRRDHALLMLADPDRAARLRTHRASTAAISTSAPAPTSAARQGPQRTHHAAHQATVTVLRAWLAERGGQPDRPAVPDPHRQAAQPRRPRTTPHQAHPPPAQHCPTLTDKHVTAHVAPTHRRDAAAPRRRRHHRDRALARTRTQSTPPRSTSTPTYLKNKPSTAPRHPRTRPLPTDRHAPRVPRSALIMPTPNQRQTL